MNPRYTIYSKKNRFKFTHRIELSHIISVSLSKYAKLSFSCCAPISKRYELNLSYFGLFVSFWVSMISSSKSMALHYYSLFAFFVFSRCMKVDACINITFYLSLLELHYLSIFRQFARSLMYSLQFAMTLHISRE